MEIVDPSLLADMIFQWHHEAPFAQDGLVEALQQSDIMDSMLADMDLPEIVDMDLSVIDTPAVARASPNAGRLWPPATPHVEVSENASEVPTSRQWASAVKPTRRVGRSGTVVNAEQQVKESRAPTHAEHIIRERQRRNDMAAKYLVLESLLPPAPKRERAVVVEDAALLVMALQRKRGELVKRRAHLQAPHQDSPRSAKRVRPCSSQLWNQQSAVETNIASCKPESPLSSSEGAVGDSQGTAASAINVHSGKEDIMVEMAWNRPPPNFLSSLLQAVESLGSAVTRCSILRVTTGLVQCFVTCSKPQVPSQCKTEVDVSETLIVGALRDLLTQSS